MQNLFIRKDINLYKRIILDIKILTHSSTQEFKFINNKIIMLI